MGRKRERLKDAGNGSHGPLVVMPPQAERGLKKKTNGAVFMRKLRTVWVQAKLIWGSPTKHERCCFSH